MKKLKKWAALGLASLLAVGSLAGCGEKKDGADQYGLDVSKVEKLSDLEDFFQQVKADNAVPDMKAGKHIAAINATYKPGVETLESGNFGDKEVVFVMLSEPYLATENLVSSLNAVSQTSKNPETAMQFLNLVNTDASLYNMICFGTEGVHYTLNEDGTAKTDETKGYDPNTDWMYGNQFNGLFREGQESDLWEKTKELNASSLESKALGFSVDSTSVTNEIASVSAVVDQYAKALETGGTDPTAVLPEFQEKLKTAGADKIIEEMQKQLDDWLSSK